MGAEALAVLKKLWSGFTFAKVERVIAREPEDVLSITIHRDDGHVAGYIKSSQTADIPEQDRGRTRVAWRHYYGFTDTGIYFQKDGYHGLDCGIDLTMDWSEWENHKGGFDKPEVGSLICGEVIVTERGKRFRKWFSCAPEFKLLVDIVLNGTNLSEHELGRRLVTRDYPDMYWAIARLALFDSVQPFVENLPSYGFDQEDPRPLHPAQGMVLGTRLPSGEGSPISYRGMWLPIGTVQYVHLISHHLKTPRWWKEFQRLAAERGLEYDHPAHGGFCIACEAEKSARDDGDYSSGFCY